MVTYLTPGLRFFHEGQLEGRRVKVSMHLGRRPEEPVTGSCRNFTVTLALPEARGGRDGRWQLPGGPSGLERNPTWDPFLAFAWEGELGQRLLVAVNYGPTQGQPCGLALC